MSTHRLIIVGAGLCGLTAATRLVTEEGWAGDEILIVEADSEVGGRLATERIGDAVFDHGAQFFTVRTPELDRAVEEWTELGLVDVWCRGFAEIDGYPRYRVRGGMRALAHHLAEELTGAGVRIDTGSPVDAVVAGDGPGAGWVTGDTSAEAILLTPPVPAAVGLLAAGGVDLGPEASGALDGFDCHRVLALLAVLDRSPDLAPPGALQQPDDPRFSFVADNGAKGLSPIPAVTFHTAHARSRELWDDPDEVILDVLAADAEEVVAPAAITELHLRRWPASGPVVPHAEPCLVAATEPGLLVLGGDGFGASKVEGAFFSGRAAAVALAGAPRSS
jgi:predicted NAD/FAD-dependent oxidoreductase